MPKDATILAAVLTRETRKVSPYWAAKDAETLYNLGRQATRIAEKRCNGIPRYDANARQYLATWTGDDEARADRETARITQRARDILKPYGATCIEVGGDPRGFVLTFKLKSGASNTMNGKWGV